MDGFSNAKLEKQTIYEIYRACRMCGAGAGYKMPIIQSVVHLDEDGAEVDLKQKIRECVQIEVYQGDKMPPLICELCVDKVNDFYEFLEMCRQTNKRTRLRLGLPPQTLSIGAPDAGDCILGITEPVYLNNDSNNQNSKSKGKNIKNSKNKPQENKIKITSIPIKKEKEKEGGDRRLEVMLTRSKQPSPPRLRGTKRSSDDDNALSLLRSKRSASTAAVQSPKSILKKTEIEEPSPRLTRQKEKELPVKKEVTIKKDVIVKKEVPEKKETPLKKVKIVIRSPPRAAKPSPTPKRPYRCKVCGMTFAKVQAMASHMKTHKKYEKMEVMGVKEKEVKPMLCSTCGKSFPNRALQSLHRCSSLVATPTTPKSQQKKVSEKCELCGEAVALRVMREHRAYCRGPPQRKPKTIKVTDLIVDPLVKRKLRPLQIRMSKCDPLLRNRLNGHYDVSDVDFGYGIDEECAYPYLWSRHVKSEPDYMVKINDDIKHALDEQDYVHWDSDDTASDLEDTSDTKKVDSLSTLSLKTIFSPKVLGKVPKKQKKVKVEKAFDSILNASDVDFDMRIGIDNIINRLDQSIDTVKDKDSDSLFGDDKPATPGVTNEDFDSIFANNDKSNVVSNDNETVVSKSNDISKVSEENNYNETKDVQSNESTNEDAKILDNINNKSEEKENNCTDNINERKGKETADKVNGAEELHIDMDDLADVSESEVDDGKLMEELDAQIGEKV